MDNQAQNAPSPGLPSDVAVLWQDALLQYSQTTGKDIRDLPQYANVDEVLKDSQARKDAFSTYRHDGKRVDRLRSSIIRSNGLLSSGARILGAGTSGVFPPSMAIPTAFNVILKAAKDLSSDFDKIADFFEEMNSFLLRLTMMEGKIPDVPAYKSHLMHVFASMLRICGFATDIIRKGRFKKWWRNIMQGTEDESLAQAYKTMERALRQLESATAFVTFTNTEEIKSATQETNMTVRQMELRTRRMEDTLDKVNEITVNYLYTKMLEHQSRSFTKKREHESQHGKDPSTSRYAAFILVKRALPIKADAAVQDRDRKSVV